MTAIVCALAALAGLGLNVAFPRIVELARRFAHENAEHSRTKDLAVSLTYLWYLRKKGARIKLGLLGSACAFGAAFLWLESGVLLQVATALMAYAALIAIKEAIVGYRVSNGLFGSTESEARDLIRFILDHADSVDFTDGNGRRRPAVLEAPASPKHSEIEIAGEVVT